jgi:hypothetical protein
LDERRVKFFPEYFDGGSSASSKSGADSIPVDVKEVWFAGCHSDMYVEQFSLTKLLS